MKLVLSQYLRTLRERDEFDRLLPELVTEMGYVPLVKPKAGIRQYGVDFPATGKSPEDGVDELLLFVIKQGDITRSVWSGSVDRVRESIEEVIDAYLGSHVPPEFSGHRKVIVLATTGDLSQDVQLNWSGFAARHRNIVFRFWGADQVSDLLEAHLLNEHLFDSQDRGELRKSLALAGDSEYEFRDFCRLLMRQLGLATDGSLSEVGSLQDRKNLVKAMRRVHLAAMICAYWAEAEGERRQAVWIMERTVLWIFHRAQLQGFLDHEDVLQVVADVWRSYCEVGARYYDRILEHLYVKDGLSGYAREGAAYSITLFEQAGILATLGLSQLAVVPDPTEAANLKENATTVADALVNMLANHSAAGSPRLDHQVVDICLGLVLLTSTGREDAAKNWLLELAGRLNYVFRANRLFPVGTDSLDDLVELDAGDADEEFKSVVKQHSWLLATIASWCAVLGLDGAYRALADGHNNFYPDVGAQLWHPTPEWSRHWYFGRGVLETGATEAPYGLPGTADELRARIKKFMADGLSVWEATSPALSVGMWAIDFVACRHFRIPLPAAVWYSMLTKEEVALTADASKESPAA